MIWCLDFLFFLRWWSFCHCVEEQEEAHTSLSHSWYQGGRRQPFIIKHARYRTIIDFFGTGSQSVVLGSQETCYVDQVTLKFREIHLVSASWESRCAPLHPLAMQILLEVKMKWFFPFSIPILFWKFLFQSWMDIRFCNAMCWVIGHVIFLQFLLGLTSLACSNPP